MWLILPWSHSPCNFTERTNQILEKFFKIKNYKRNFIEFISYISKKFELRFVGNTNGVVTTLQKINSYKALSPYFTMT